MEKKVFLVNVYLRHNNDELRVHTQDVCTSIEHAESSASALRRIYDFRVNSGEDIVYFNVLIEEYPLNVFSSYK